MMRLSLSERASPPWSWCSTVTWTEESSLTFELSYSSLMISSEDVAVVNSSVFMALCASPPIAMATSVAVRAVAS